MKSSKWIVLVLGVAGCLGSAADHERLGDDAYLQGDWAAAADEYQAAVRSGDARVYAKLGAAATRNHDYAAAAEAYRDLASADDTRQLEAARGLERVIALADRDSSGVAIESAVRSLRLLAPERVKPEQTLFLFRSGRLADADAVGLAPLALAAAGDASAVDQILVQYAALLQGTLACDEAASVGLTALRRSREPSLRRRAAESFARCGIQLGQEALTMGQPERAAKWFGRVVTFDSLSEAGRRALVGLGDARVALGDILGATLAFEDAMRDQRSPDTTTVLARQRLTALGRSANADSSGAPSP